MRKKLLIALLCFTPVFCYSQVGVGTQNPNKSAALDVSSTNKGMLIPRMTSEQRRAISTPAFGLLVFDTDRGAVMMFDGASWRALSFQSESEPALATRTTQDADAITEQFFGASVSLSGNYAAVSAPGYGRGALTNMGVVYIFHKTSAGWLQQARITAKDSSAGGNFGGSISLAGDYLAVGSPGKTVGSNLSQGKVYLYKRNNTTWDEEAQITRSSGAAQDKLGYSVAYCSNATGGAILYIGAPSTSGLGSGAAYAYKKNTSSGVWATIQTLAPADLVNGDGFGYSISADSNHVGIGAVYKKKSNLSVGAAYIYLNSRGTLSLQQKLDGVTEESNFGFSLSLQSDRLAVSAPSNIRYENNSAYVSIYNRSGSSWTLFDEIRISSGTSNELKAMRFGAGLSLYGDYLLIGGSGGYVTPIAGWFVASLEGSVYIYKSGNSSYNKIGMIHATESRIGNLFGSAIAVDKNNFVIGEPNALVNDKTKSGKVHFGVLP
jgi:hypothetical protein